MKNESYCSEAQGFTLYAAKIVMDTLQHFITIITNDQNNADRNIR